MITPFEISKVTMTEEKKKSARNDFFAYYVGRPISYVLTVPFLYTNISPNAVSVMSVIPLVIGFIASYFAQTKGQMIFIWCCFFLWNLLDGVDGNIARYKKQFSDMGSVYDAMAGYVAMFISFLTWGIIAAHNQGVLNGLVNIPSDVYIILGALSGTFVIFPRLIMHKALSTLKDKAKGAEDMKDKANYGIVKIIGLNLLSISGFIQVLMLLSIVFAFWDVFTIMYFVLNLLVMMISLKSILSKK